MGVNVIVASVMSGVFLLIALVVPWLLPKSENRSVYRMCVVLAVFCFWLFWLLAYLAQANPLIGPKIPLSEFRIMNRHWFSQ